MKTDYIRSEHGSQKQTLQDEYAEALEYLTDRFISYEFCYSEETGFIETSSMERVKDNQFIAMLRRDYLTQSGGNLRGKDLDRTLRMFMQQAKRFLSERIKDDAYKDYVKEVDL